MIDKSLVNKIFLACQDNNVEYLKNRDVKEILNARDERDATCVHYSVRGGNQPGVVALEYLVNEFGCSTQEKSNIGALPIHDACAKGNLEAASWLLSNSDCGLDKADISGTLPIHLAAGFGHLDIVELLVKDHNASLNVKTNTGARPLHFAATNGHGHIVKFIIDYIQSELESLENEEDSVNHHHGLDEPHEACRLCQMDSFINVQMDSGATPVYMAAQEGQFEILQYLVYEGKANTKILAYDGMSCLHAAAQNGHFAIVQWLINDQKLGMNAKEIDGGMTALHFAAGSGRINMVDWLLQNDAKISTDQLGGTPLHSAAHYGYVECAQVILESGCDPDLEDTDGLTATDIAAMSGQFGYAGYITKWKKEKSSEQARLKRIAATVLENMRRKIPSHLKIPMLPQGTSNGDIPEGVSNGDQSNGEDEEPDYERAMSLEDMINIPPPPSYPPPDVPTPPNEHRLSRQSRLDEAQHDKESDADSPSAVNKFRIIAQMKKASMEKRSDRSSDSRSSSPTPGNSKPSSRSNSFRAVAKFKQASIKKRNITDSDQSAEDAADETSSRSSSFRAIAKFKQASIERRNQSSPDRSTDTDSKPNSPHQSDHQHTSKQSFKAIAMIKQASVERRTRTSSEKSTEDDSRSGSPHRTENTTSSRSSSFRAIAKFKQASIEKRNQSSIDNMNDEEARDRRAISPKEINRIKREENIENKVSPMKRQNSLKLVAKMTKATKMHTSKETDEGTANNNRQIEDEKGNENINTEDDQTKSENMFASNKILNKMKAWASSSKSDSQESLPPFKEQEEDDYKTKTDDKKEENEKIAWKDKMNANKDNQNIQNQTSSNHEDTSKNQNKPWQQNTTKPETHNNNNTTAVRSWSRSRNDGNGNTAVSDASKTDNKPTSQSSRSSLTRRWPPVADNVQGSDADAASDAGGNDNGKLVVDELKESDLRSSLRKIQKNGKGQSMVFFGATSTGQQKEAKSAHSSQQRPDSTVLIGEYDPKHFLDQVPPTDTSGNELPLWKRMLVAKQVAEKAYSDMVEKRKKEELEAKYKDMPVWKREILRKKEEERMAVSGHVAE